MHALASEMSGRSPASGGALRHNTASGGQDEVQPSRDPWQSRCARYLCHSPTHRKTSPGRQPVTGVHVMRASATLLMREQERVPSQVRCIRWQTVFGGKGECWRDVAWLRRDLSSCSLVRARSRAPRHAGAWWPMPYRDKDSSRSRKREIRQPTCNRGRASTCTGPFWHKKATGGLREQNGALRKVDRQRRAFGHLFARRVRAI